MVETIHEHSLIFNYRLADNCYYCIGAYRCGATKKLPRDARELFSCRKGDYDGGKLRQIYLGTLFSFTTSLPIKSLSTYFLSQMNWR